MSRSSCVSPHLILLQMRLFALQPRAIRRDALGSALWHKLEAEVLKGVRVGSMGHRSVLVGRESVWWKLGECVRWDLWGTGAD